jgi:proteasome lid subunit RPN8/RPN11
MAKDKNSDPKAGQPAAQVKVRSMAEEEKPVRRKFPGPRGAASKLRIAIERTAYAELIAHAKSSLQAEVCGVLAGDVCEDDEGLFVHVEAVIRGTAASQASTHVTFTQETWNVIHRTLEKDFPDLRIVGWYHTHPGFGVEFSEMDLFIQRNFFPGPTQLALVTDPVNGDVAICINTPTGIQYLEAFWVDGREQKCRLPARQSEQASQSQASAGASVAPDKIQALESRVAQLVQSLDEMKTFHYRLLMVCGFVFCLGIVGTVVYAIRSQYFARLEAPKLLQTVPVPVQIGDKTAMLQVSVTGWQIPDELNAMMVKAIQLEEERAAKEAMKAASNLPPVTVTNSAQK